MATLKANKAQEEAIATINGPMIIVSCPGSGKTTTLVRRIHHMVEEQIPPSNILMVTFSRAAAKEMEEKYVRLFGDNPGITFRTIHSLCLQMLVEEQQCQLSDIIDERTKGSILINILRGLRVPFERRSEMKDGIATWIGVVKSNGIDINDKDFNPDCCDKAMFAQVYRAYTNAMQDIGKIDYEDMLIKAYDLLLSDELILTRWQAKYPYIQCDEYQDTNRIQRDILYLLAGKDGNLCVVGDDDQSIYRFRGARPEIMLKFPNDFPTASVIRMSTNYRSGAEVVARADKLIRYNKTRFDKDFVSQRGEDGFVGSSRYIKCDGRSAEVAKVVEEIKKAHQDGMAYEDMAILFRTKRQAQFLVSELCNAEIPFYSELAITTLYDSKIYHDIRTYAYLGSGALKNRQPEMILSVLNAPNRYLPTDLFRNVPYTLDAFMQAVYPLSKGEGWKYSAALKSLREWMTYFGEGKISLSAPSSELFSKLVGKNSIHYDRDLTAAAQSSGLDFSDAQAEYEALEEDAKKYPSIREWFICAEKIRKLTEEKNKERRKQKPEGVALATMHSSKGLEWKLVFIIDTDHGVIPHKDNSDTLDGLEEERRLFYVAMTRAKDNLVVLSSSKHPSDFIGEAALLTDEERRRQQSVPKYLPGKKVKHVAFGEGEVVSYGAHSVTVQFEKRKVKLAFPGTFQKELIKYV